MKKQEQRAHVEWTNKAITFSPVKCELLQYYLHFAFFNGVYDIIDLYSIWSLNSTSVCIWIRLQMMLIVFSFRPSEWSYILMRRGWSNIRWQQKRVNLQYSHVWVLWVKEYLVIQQLTTRQWSNVKRKISTRFKLSLTLLLSSVFVCVCLTFCRVPDLRSD